MSGASDRATDKIEGFQTENKRVKAAAAFMDVAKAACGGKGVAS